MDNILEVRNLKISFRTNNGILKAVRDISFDLERGKTLAIVGESGSGKSVTSKAILGILAGNSIIEGGKILYDGKDLLKISEDDMYKIRGDKISMIFQDPLSSLNPIVKIGKQITEAMLLKNKANRKEARADFNTLLEILRVNIISAVGSESADEVTAIIKTFDKFNIEADNLENKYNLALTAAVELTSDISDFLFKISKKQKLDVKAMLLDYSKRITKIKDQFLTKNYDSEISSLRDRIIKARFSYKPTKVYNEASFDEVTKVLNDVVANLAEITSQTRPNFFRIGYYKLMNPSADLSVYTPEELENIALKYLNENFMDKFIDLEVKGLKFSYNAALENKKKVVAAIPGIKAFFSTDFTKEDANATLKSFSELVESSIDRLETTKDSVAYTLRSSLSSAIKNYFYYKANNPKEERRYEIQTKKRDKLIACGKTVTWKVVPKVVYDLNDLRANIIAVIDRLEERYNDFIEHAGDADFYAKGVSLIDFLKDKASQVVYKVTYRMAKENAIKLMDEVGIHDPRRRFYQYPFEFSGGMRQRIVIAIALAANPDILICDEPTTALDVTIQAQILELINKLKEERGLSVIFITHDLGVVANMADTIAVMYSGKIVEYGTAEEIFYDPRHPYTWALLSSMPDLDTKEKLDAIPGTPPNMIYPPKGDAFAERNKYAMQIDFEEHPPFFDVSPTHKAATWLLHPDAPKVELPKIITDRINRMKSKTKGDQNG